MAYGTKIATCSYCGTRAALVLAGETRHELACRSCGAPLHVLKSLKGHEARSDRRAPERQVRPAKPAKAHHHKARKRKKTRHRRRVLHEIFDLIEDVFD